MPRSPDWSLRVAILALAGGGFALTLWFFHPGIVTFDAKYIYQDVVKGGYGDWQSPLMVALWKLIDPIAPGPAAMLLFTAGLYWTTFALLGVTLARLSAPIALATPLLGLMPPAFVFTGIIWRDILFASIWLLAAVLVFIGARCSKTVRPVTMIVAVALIAAGVLLRPNAILAAPILLGFAVWPRAFNWKRTALIALPAAAAFYALIPLVYYGVFNAQRQNPLHSLLVYDIAGITHFAKENQFPVSWSEQENRLLTQSCYSPRFWDVYWTYEPCLFVMERLEKDKLFGTPAIPSAWRAAVMRHPLAYLQHRLAFTWQFLARNNLAMWTFELDDTEKRVFPDRPQFTALVSLQDALKRTPLFRVGFWLALCGLLCALAWRRRHDVAGAFTLGVCGSAIVYVGTFAVLGVAADFRYGLWAVLAALGSAPVLAAHWYASRA